MIDPDLTSILDAFAADAEDEATYKLLAATHDADEGRGISVEPNEPHARQIA